MAPVTLISRRQYHAQDKQEHIHIIAQRKLKADVHSNRGTGTARVRTAN